MLVRGVYTSLRRVIIYTAVLFWIIYLISTFHTANSNRLNEYLKLKFQNEDNMRITPFEIFNNKITEVNNEGNKNALLNSIYKTVFSDEISGSNWKFHNSFQNYRVDSSLLNEYIEKRNKEHYYDPRITMSVYLSSLNDIYNDDDVPNVLPFSWEDWVDLSYLNDYLYIDDEGDVSDDDGDGDLVQEEKNLNCSSFLNLFNVKIKSQIDNNELSIKYFNETNCLDFKEYATTEDFQFKNPKSLTGFNFLGRLPAKSKFIGKIYSAKSFILTGLKPPEFIYFLNDNGSYYKVETVKSKSMMENELFNKFINKEEFNEFNPINEMNKMNNLFEINNVNDLKNKLTKDNLYQMDVSEDKFDFKPNEMIEEIIYKGEEELSNYEINFINSINNSINIDSNNLDKYFHEVEISWPETYNLHKVIENGSHYDYRFFSGFLTEMPKSKFTFHSPNFNKFNKTDKKLDNTINRRSIILSNLIHTLLTTTFHDGLIMYPAHGSLLSWYFTGASFPWDSDGDVQMPIVDLAEFCLNYNNSMVVQNPKYGMGKYYVDCTNSLTHRGKSNGKNNIDARFIDIDTGYFVDITGLSISSDRLTKEYFQKLDNSIKGKLSKEYPFKSTKKKSRRIGESRGINLNYKVKEEEMNSELREQVYKFHKENQIYNCRNDHYYTLKQLSPVRLTLFEGAPTIVPLNKKYIKEILKTEYKDKSMNSEDWLEWIYSKSLMIWLNAGDILEVCKENNLINAGKNIRKNRNIPKRNKIKGNQIITTFYKNENKVLSELIKYGLYEITEDEIFEIKTSKEVQVNIMEEMFQNREYCKAHQNEMTIFMSEWEWKNDNKYYKRAGVVPNDWKSLGEWMQLDHAPCKMAMLDYLIGVEQ